MPPAAILHQSGGIFENAYLRTSAHLRNYKQCYVHNAIFPRYLPFSLASGRARFQYKHWRIMRGLHIT